MSLVARRADFFTRSDEDYVEQLANLLLGRAVDARVGDGSFPLSQMSVLFLCIWLN